jgi:sugar phosphate isomerase/epimerase
VTREEPGPHLACSTAAFFARPVRDAFAAIADAGFDGVEVMVGRDPATQDAERLRRLSDEHGLAIRALHAPFLIVSRRVWGTDPVGKVYRAIELAERADVPLVVVHPPFRWQAGYRRWVDERLGRLSERTGVRVAVENMFPIPLRRRPIALHAHDVLGDLDRFPHVVLDTSHAGVSGLDLLECYRALRDRLAHVHLSNNAGRGWDSHASVESGVLPIGDLLDALAADGFARTVSLELDLRPWLDDAAGLRGVLRRNRAFCEARLSLAAGSGGIGADPRADRAAAQRKRGTLPAPRASEA